ncbi:hypothetical protein KIN20_032421 [Parelaphostrongylus tenuis]|uniref:Ubiquitin-like domain-containing protein n=1 Tax=Parelaphostrongylus tenuis TaxID=148309 RepID=A0AAD5R755_PARTN|nr:hypothetical protein KIN20_032421 [Parelaphostrongylus tenuis]
MKLNIKNRLDGSAFQIEISLDETMGELRSKIASKIGNSQDKGAVRILLGAEELKFSDSATIKNVGLVSGDRLFIETCPSASSKPADSGQSHSGENEKCVDGQKSVSMDSDEDIDQLTSFRDRVIRAVRDYMEDSQYSNSFLQSWSGQNLSGAELQFEFERRKETSNIFILITAFPSPTVSAVVNVGRIVDLSRKLLWSFTVQPASVRDNVMDGVAHALSSPGATGVTLIHLFSLRCIREQILMHMDPSSVTRLSGVSRILRSVLLSPSVDRTYWMKRLSSDFGQEAVQKAQTSGITYRRKYIEEYAMRRLQRQSGALLDHSYASSFPLDMIFPPHQPQPNVPDRPRYPNGPLFPAPDPLQPIPNPMNPLIQPPRVDPFGPEGAPFGGQGGPFGRRNPLNPFDPNNREIFPSPPNGGVPRRGPRYFPANQWDMNDFI